MSAWQAHSASMALEETVLTSSFFHFFAHRCTSGTTAALGPISSLYCCNPSSGGALIVGFSTNGMCVKNNTAIYVARASNSKRDCDAWSLLLLAATVWNFAHIPLGISDRNKMLLWPGCEGRAKFSLHTKNVWSVWFVVKRTGCCCNLPGGVVWFTTNGMCSKNKNTYAWREQAIIREIATHDLYCCLLQCETLRTCRSGFPIATI